MGSFDGMLVKVAFFHYLLVYFIPEHERKLVLSVHVTAQRDMARHLVHMAAWILVCERACSVTPRAWDVSRDKVHVSWFNEG